MNVAIVYCTTQAEHRIELEVPAGTTIGAAIEVAGLSDQEPMLQSGALKVGIWNRIARLEDLVREGDRIEIYRPLTVDPKEGRRLRSELRRKRGKSGSRA